MGSCANVSFDGTRFFMVPGAQTNQTLNVDKGSSVGVTEVYIYRVDVCSALSPRHGEKIMVLCKSVVGLATA